MYVLIFVKIFVINKVNSLDDIKQYWSNDMIDELLFSFEELRMKTLGVSGLWKARRHLYRSDINNAVKLYIGVANEYNGAIIVRGLVKFISVINPDTKITSDTSTTAIIMKVSPGMDDHPTYQFGPRLCQTLGRCTNYMGCRPISWCNHIIAAALHFYNVVMEIPTEKPTPRIHKAYSNVLNITNYIHHINSMDPDTCMSYLENTFDSNEWLSDGRGNTIDTIRN